MPCSPVATEVLDINNIIAVHALFRTILQISSQFKGIRRFVFRGVCVYAGYAHYGENG